MRLPDGSTLMHAGRPYDPAKAREYYLRTRKLKGRKKGSTQPTAHKVGAAVQPPSPGSTKQKVQLKARIDFLETRLKKLDKLIAQKERDAKKGEAKKERAAKEAAKPDTAAEKAEKARESKKFRDKHKQEIKTKAKQAKSSGAGSSKSSTDKSKAANDTAIADLKTLSTKLKGQLAVAKSKLKAL